MNDHPKADAKASPRPPQITAEATITTSRPDGHHDDQTRSETLPARPRAIINTTMPTRSSPASPDGPNDDDQIVSYIGESAGSPDDDRDDLGHANDPAKHRPSQAKSIADICLRLTRTNTRKPDPFARSSHDGTAIIAGVDRCE